MPQRHRDTEAEGLKDREGRKYRGTGGQREGAKTRSDLFVPLSVCLVVFLSVCGSVAASIQNGSFEKQALRSAQDVSASDLDKALPNRPFSQWFTEVAGPNAGVVWQLTECGDPIGQPGDPGYDMPACAEINATLADGRKVFIAISVGTFKKGMIGKPTFFHTIIEQNEQFHQIRRLSELPQSLRDHATHSTARLKKRITDLPAINMDSGSIIAPVRYLAPPLSGVPPITGDPSQEKEPAPEPPPRTQVVERIPESVSQSRAVIKVMPDYSDTAKKMDATGPVKVEITISEAGLVIEATAISGHLALRSAAVEAARKWVFAPARVNGENVRVKSVLTFVFAPSAK